MFSFFFFERLGIWFGIGICELSDRRCAGYEILAYRCQAGVWDCRICMAWHEKLVYWIYEYITYFPFSLVQSIPRNSRMHSKMSTDRPTDLPIADRSSPEWAITLDSITFYVPYFGSPFFLLQVPVSREQYAENKFSSSLSFF